VDDFDWSSSILCPKIGSKKKSIFFATCQVRASRFSQRCNSFLLLLVLLLLLWQLRMQWVTPGPELQNASSEHMPKRMPETMSERISDRMPDRCQKI